ncbi:hypothetical protein N9N67_12275 [Bacteriovoracaceae bacterium]|nr:hypothetical protein [Bacteriovoracaceae bacterium]
MLLLFTFQSVYSESEEEAFLKTQSLTDEQHKVSQEYLHMGLHDKKVKEICGENNDSDYCTGNAQAWSSGTFATFERMIPVASSMYSMMIVSGAKKIGYMETHKGVEHHKEVMDVCGMAPTAVDMATKATAAGMQKHTNEQVENQSTGFAQVDALHATAKTHEENQKMAKVQAWGWGIAAGCYAATMAYGNSGATGVSIKGSDARKIGVRLAGATLLTVFYKKKADVHGAHIEAINQEIAKFPKKGDCNPYTQTLCFCREDSSKHMDPQNYMKVCLPKDYGDKARMFAPLSCVDQHNRPDPTCQCNQSNSCISRLFMNDLQNLPANSTGKSL